MNKDLWRKLSLTEDELTKMVVEKDWLEKAKEVGKNCLVGKLVLNKRVNVGVMKNVLNTCGGSLLVWSLRN